MTTVRETRVYGTCRPEITFCPLHNTASDLLGACKLLVAYCADMGEGFKDPALDRIRDIIDRAEATPGKEPT